MIGPKITKLIELGNSGKGISAARSEARKHLPEFPHNGCATFLSCLLREAGIDVPVIVGAEELARHLQDVRGWKRVKNGDQRPGDVGVTNDANHNGRTDHIYVVLAVAANKDAMTIADNQASFPHGRYVSGHGKTPTAYFLRGNG